MTVIHLEAQYEKVANENPYRLKQHPLYHQMRTLEALDSHDLVMNTYNTGTGKTIASLLYLFKLQGSNKNVLFIAPTNALLGQHAEDIADFVRENNLNFQVKRVTAAEARAIANGLRPGETLQRLIHNYLEFEQSTAPRRPLILVVNPDIFYYALYFRYGAHDRRNIFERFLTAFDYMIIDEFHYYDYKQLANFLFAFALFDQFGYFAVRSRKICLLSATPAMPVTEYLNHLFGTRWTRIGPDNEPPRSENLATIPALTPLTLEIAEGEITEYIATQGKELIEWVTKEDLDGALISSSLARINKVYGILRTKLDIALMGRITGPEPETERQQVTARNLILATPTVDIGYNFVKKGKLRQHVDFLICDARYGDELLQRIGRAGRVLGQEQTDIPSHAQAILPKEAASHFAAADGQTLTRADFAQLVQNCAQLPAKHMLTAYVRSHAITECFWPIFQLGKMMPDDLTDELEALFMRVCEIFMPTGNRAMWSLKRFFQKHESRERWLNDSKRAIPHDRFTAQHTADWICWLDPFQGQVDPKDLQPHLPSLLSSAAQQQNLRNFIQSQVAITRALFSFRDSFQGPTVVIYDRNQIFSSQLINRYDLFHLLRNYRLSPPLTRAQFMQNYAETELTGNFYFALFEERTAPIMLEFVYRAEAEQTEFEQKWCGLPVALSGLRLQAREKGGDVISGELDQRLITALVDTYLPLLIVAPQDVGAATNRLRGSSLRAQRLTILYPDGTMNDGYHAYLGTAAFQAHAELIGHFLFKERRKRDAIIL